MKKQSVSAVLELILTELEAGRMPDAVLIRQGRSSLRAVSRSLKAATAAAAASGKSGRKAIHDHAAITAYIKAHPEESQKSIADRFGCNQALVSILARKLRN